MISSYSQQAQSNAYAGEPAPPPSPRTANLMATVNANICALEQVVDTLASRTVGMRDTACGASGQQGVPVTYAALAEDLAGRTERLLNALHQITSEI